VLAELTDIENTPEYIADRAVARLLLGTFPYGRPDLGTRETLEAIDFADLRFAYDRLFGADNATLTISGKIDQNLAIRAVRRFFGSWRKSDRQVPPTFRRPDEPEKERLVIGTGEAATGVIYRTAVRGVARNEKDYHAYTVLAAIMEERLRSRMPADKRDSVIVRHDAFFLPGMLTVGHMAEVTSKGSLAGEGNDPFQKALAEPITAAEFSRAKNSLQLIRSGIDPVAFWLDADTYKFSSPKAESDAFAALMLADVQRAADKVKTAPAASVVAFLRPANSEQ
jgi:predicted Zn-dependent peptidase